MHSFQEFESNFERCFLKLTGAYDLQPEPTKDPVLTKLGKELNLKFITTDSLDLRDISYGEPTPAQLERAIESIAFEFGLYPHEALRRTRLEQVVLCNELRLRQKKAAGTLKVGLHVVDTIFIDVNAFRHDIFGRHTLHHELFHAIDFRDTPGGYVDTEWRKMQDAEYVYELDSAVEYHYLKRRDPESWERPEFADPYDWLTTSPSEEPGFITEYSKYSHVEDKAEVFSHLMMAYHEVMQRCMTDEVLNRKVEKMKELAHNFCDELDDEFWNRIANCKRHLRS